MTFTRREYLAASASMLGRPALGAIPGPNSTPSAPGEHRLWYAQPAKVWTEALPVGNGRIGAMIFGGTGQERLQLNEDTLWSGGPYDPVNPQAAEALPQVRALIAKGDYAAAQALANAAMMARPLHQMAYQTLGDLLIDMPLDGPVETYRRELDLDAALGTTRFAANGTVIEREIFASPADQVIALRLHAKGGLLPPITLRLQSPHNAETEARGDSLLLSGQGGTAEGIPGALRFAARLRVIAPGGTGRAQGDALHIDPAPEVILLLAMATSYRGPQDVSGDPQTITERQIAAASALPFAALRRRHLAQHRRLYRSASLQLTPGKGAALPTDQRIAANESEDDPALAALYFHYARYLLICSSRPGCQPANLQGIWNDKTNPPWGSKYTININTQMNYWPADPVGLGECFEPLLRLTRELAQTGRETARRMYGARGWVAHHNTDLWRATAPIDGAAWGLWPMGGAWLCNMLWDRWDYGHDRTYLEAIYPLMQGACLFFLDTLQPSARGLVTSPSISPENTHPFGASVCAGPAMDRQILRDLFDRTADAANKLGKDADFAAQLAKARAALAPDRIGKSGQLQEWLEDWDDAAPEPNHRHVSHLYALYPSQQIAPDTTPDLARAARVSLEKRGDESTGWATAWRIALWARLGDGERAHRILRFLLGRGRTYPNLFDAHPPFQIDGNFGGCAAMAEMLINSRDGMIHLLPALPSAWREGAAAGLMARGGVRVDLVWRNGKLAQTTLTAMRAQDCKLRLGAISRPVRLVPGRAMRFKGPHLLPA
ncbi:glycoside hydrolase family 95 protein [Novosphingobium humi]|uniref:glycoside hydrolase family 95 protein n=1 Tax=Novosphingobium humi TaxID=2282397 RepID=UPI0025B147D9|nr:glycoside hydrolase family 95 protein [Novosphingobium humi]WJT00989.1 glycoside hydrolase family 95 protein [Novosphingobium humi]